MWKIEVKKTKENIEEILQFNGEDKSLSDVIDLFDYFNIPKNKLEEKIKYTASISLKSGYKINIINLENIELLNTTPPKMSGNLIYIPEKFEWLFKNDTFKLNNFVINFTRIEQEGLYIDESYLKWENFIKELNSPINNVLKNILIDVWEYCLEQIENENFRK